jgi:type I restriction enzyme S subunit
MFRRESLLGREILTKTLRRVVRGTFVIARMQIVHGASALATSEFGGCAISKSYSSFEGTPQCDASYFAWLATLPFMYAYFLDSSHGVVIEKMTFDQTRWLSLPVYLPPVSEQRRINRILATIDDAIRSTEQLIVKLKQMKLGLLHDLLTRGIDAGGHLRDPRRHPEQFIETALGSLPRTWATARLGDFCEILSGSTPSRQAGSLYYAEEGVPWVKTLDLNEDRLTETEEYLTEFALKNASCPMLRAGTVLVAMYGGWAQIGRTALLEIDATTNQAVSGLSILDQTEPAFLLRALQHGRNRWTAVAASTRKDPNITKKDVAEFLVPVPPPNEQAAIVERFEQHLTLIRSETSALNKLRLLKIGLADDLLTGRVRVGVGNWNAA